MATVWELITQNSALPVNGVNTAWDHLNNQLAGSLVINDPVYIEKLEVEADMPEIEIDVPSIEIEIESTDVEVEIEETTYEVEID